MDAKLPDFREAAHGYGTQMFGEVRGAHTRKHARDNNSNVVIAIA